MSRFDNILEYDNSLAGAGLRIGIVMSRFNLPVCEGLLSACVAELKRLGVADGDMVDRQRAGRAGNPARACKAWRKAAGTTRWSPSAPSFAATPTTSRWFPTTPAAPSWTCNSIPASRSPMAS